MKFTIKYLLIYVFNALGRLTLTMDCHRETNPILST